MANKPKKLVSGRSGYSAYDNRYNPRNEYVLRPNSQNPIVGEKTTVRSGAKSSKTYITLGSGSAPGSKSYVASTTKPGKKAPKKK